MARKNGMKNDSLTFNSRTKAVMADVIHENIKEKVSAVREVVTGKSNNEIVLVLQYYDYDVEKAIQAYLEDGAKLALTEWHYSGAKPVKKKRNKKKGGAQEASKSPESVSSESTTSTPGYLANGDIARDPPNQNGLNHPVAEANKSPQKSPQKVPVNDSRQPPVPVMNGDLHTASIGNNNTSSSSNNNNYSSSISGTPVENHVETSADARSSPQPQRQSHAHHNRQRTHSGTHAEKKHLKAERDRTSSTSSVTDPVAVKKAANHGLEKSSKDLHRQTVSLERLKLVFNEEVERTCKKVKVVFDDLRTCLNAREAVLLREVDTLRDTGRDVFIMRQGLAADLKVKIDRADRMSDTELADLRLEIKHFVADRKVDEDLGRTTRYLYDDDSLKAAIRNFSEVVPVNCSYIQQCQHSLSPVISTQSSVSQSPPPSQNDSRSPSTQQTNSVTKQDQSTPSVSHLDDKSAHEVAELPRRLKNSLVLEGIAVETYPERPASAPATSRSPAKSSRGRPASGTGRNRNRQSRDFQDRRQNGPRDEPRGSYEQTSGGERVILIGKSTRGAAGSSRPGRGGRGRGGRGRGGNQGGRPDSREGGARTEASGGETHLSTISEKPLGQRENSGSPRRRGGNRGNRAAGNQRNRQNSPVKSVNSSPTKPTQTDAAAAAVSSGTV